MDKDYQKARERITLLCSRREMCSSEVLAKLAAWKLSSDDQKKLLSLLADNNFVDDRRYAFAFVRHHHRLKKWGKHKIRYSLLQKKIPEPLIDEALKEISPEDYHQTLVAELRKKLPAIKVKNRYDLMARLQRFALSRGYEAEVIRKALEDVV